MSDVACHKLAELVARYGRDLGDDPRRCEALLRDVCGQQYKREIFVLVSAAREGVPAQLQQSSSGSPAEVVVLRLIQHLHDNLGLSEDLARWAVESWAFAMKAAGYGHTKPRPVGSLGTAGSDYSRTAIGLSAEEHDLFAEFPRVPAEEVLRQTIRGVLADGIVTDEERAEVQRMRQELGIAPDVAARVVAEVRAELAGRPGNVPPKRKRRKSATGATPAAPPLPRPGALADTVVLGILRGVGAVHGLYVAPDIPPKKLQNAQVSCQVPADEQILGLIDATVFGSAKNGLAFGTRGVYYHNSWGKLPGTHAVAYQEFLRRSFAGAGRSEVAIGVSDSFNLAGAMLGGVIVWILHALKDGDVMAQPKFCGGAVIVSILHALKEASKERPMAI